MRDIEEGEAIKCGDWMPAVNERKKLIVQLLSQVRLMWRGHRRKKGRRRSFVSHAAVEYLLGGEVTSLEFIGEM